MRGTIIAVLAAVVLCAQVEVAAAQPPPRFFGVMGNGPLDRAGVDLVKETALMRSNGVETVRLPIEWPDLQPYRSFTDVPAKERARFVDVAGIPTAFAATDARIKASALSNVEVLALVMRSPLWAGRDPSNYMTTPRDPDQYGAFLTALIGRYGPNGSFWIENPGVPRRPLRHFQIWNEPNLKHYFPVASWAPAYAKLLRTSYKAIKAADSKATVVTAGMPNFAWRDYAKLFRAGVRARGYFDAVAVHPYTDNAAGCVEILSRVRRVLDANGARQTPIWVTETGWPSAQGKAKVLPQHRGWITTPAGEATKLTAAYRAYAKSAKQLKLTRVYWYSWVSSDLRGGDAWDFAGLRTVRSDGSFVDKPALAAYRSVARSLRAATR
jgi:hypothetical protein